MRDKVLILPKAISDDTITRKLSKYSTAEKGLSRRAMEVKMNYKLEEGSEEIEAAREAIRKRIDKSGMLVFDLETYVDNSIENAKLGNTVPFMLCAYGTAYYDSMLTVHKKDAAEGGARVKMMHVDECFVSDSVYGKEGGLTCVEKFVIFIVDNGIMQMQECTKETSAGA